MNINNTISSTLFHSMSWHVVACPKFHNGWPCSRSLEPSWCCPTCVSCWQPNLFGSWASASPALYLGGSNKMEATRSNTLLLMTSNDKLLLMTSMIMIIIMMMMMTQITVIFIIYYNLTFPWSLLSLSPLSSVFSLLSCLFSSSSTLHHYFLIHFC